MSFFNTKFSDMTPGDVAGAAGKAAIAGGAGFLAACIPSVRSYWTDLKWNWMHRCSVEESFERHHAAMEGRDTNAEMELYAERLFAHDAKREAALEAALEYGAEIGDYELYDSLVEDDDDDDYYDDDDYDYVVPTHRASRSKSYFESFAEDEADRAASAAEAARKKAAKEALRPPKPVIDLPAAPEYEIIEMSVEEAEDRFLAWNDADKPGFFGRTWLLIKALIVLPLLMLWNWLIIPVIYTAVACAAIAVAGAGLYIGYNMLILFFAMFGAVFGGG